MATVATLTITLLKLFITLSFLATTKMHHIYQDTQKIDKNINYHVTKFFTINLYNNTIMEY